jgi:hypothetical protein
VRVSGEIRSEHSFPGYKGDPGALKVANRCLLAASVLPLKKRGGTSMSKLWLIYFCSLLSVKLRENPDACVGDESGKYKYFLTERYRNALRRSIS